MESGFVIIPGPIPAQRIPDLAAAHDKVMSSGSGPDFKMASTTTRMHYMVNRGPAFDEIYIHPPLLEACAHVICEPFKHKYWRISLRTKCAKLLILRSTRTLNQSVEGSIPSALTKFSML
jgi:hypothetical protein